MTSRALLLDLDRTLIDLQTYTDYAAALADVEALLGTWTDADVPGTDWDRPTQSCMAVLHSLLGDPRWQDVSAAIARHEREAIDESRLMPTVDDVVARLVPLPVGVVTLLPVDVAIEVLVRHGIGVGVGQPIDLVVGRDPRVRPKPWPDGPLAACDRLGAPPAGATMIGDSTWDQEAADRAGIAFIGVPSSPVGFPPEVPVEGTLAEAVDRALAP